MYLSERPNTILKAVKVLSWSLQEVWVLVFLFSLQEREKREQKLPKKQKATNYCTQKTTAFKFLEAA
jgi:hypothetical protein